MADKVLNLHVLIPPVALLIMLLGALARGVWMAAGFIVAGIILTLYGLILATDWRQVVERYVDMSQRRYGGRRGLFGLRVQPRERMVASWHLYGIVSAAVGVGFLLLGTVAAMWLRSF